MSGERFAIEYKTIYLWVALQLWYFDGIENIVKQNVFEFGLILTFPNQQYICLHYILVQ